MILDANKYRLNIQSIKELTKDKTTKERLAFIGILAVTTGVPIIIVANYIGEIYGFTPELDKFIVSLMAFYTVTHVINVNRGAL